MAGILTLLFFLMCGVALSDAAFHRYDRLTRLWLGLCAGLIEMMWLPALFAFAIRFTKTAQFCGAGAAALVALIALVIARGKPRNRRWSDMPRWLLPSLVVPLLILGGYLQYTHTIREIGGALYVGQSTYGDLCLHLGIATSLRNAPFPPDYSLLPGARLGYPFLADSMVTTMLLMGTGLRTAFVVTGTLMLALVFAGFVILCWHLTKSIPATVIAYVLLFINGGLGFIYALDGVWKDPSAFRAIFTGFYKTPTNQPDLNLRWVNLICDMLIPQRTLLCGWMALIPAIYLLALASSEGDRRTFIALGVWAGTLPMIHTHSFLALGLMSAGAMARYVIAAPRDQRRETLLRFVLYGAVAVALALPQLLAWSVPQTVKGGSLRFRFNWVNNQGNGMLIDGYVWFWVKNVGLTWLLMAPAALNREGRKASGRTVLRRALAVGALAIYVVAELIQFQPNEYDNNKLFYVAYMLMMPAMGLYLVDLFARLRGLRGRVLLAAVFMLVSTLSGALSIAREVVSSYQLFGPEEVRAAAWVESNLPEDAVFLTGSQHNNAVAALAGRRIVCGTGSYLYFHGIDYGAQAFDERMMLENPGDSLALFERYGVGYAYISSHEKSAFDVDEAWFALNGEAVFRDGDVAIYALPDYGEAYDAQS